MNIEQILAPWTDKHMAAAQAEGWDLFTTTDAETVVQLQRIDDPEELERIAPGAKHLPSDDYALAMVRCGTGEHHRVARQILHDHFPAEWANMERAYAAAWGAPIIIPERIRAAALAATQGDWESTGIVIAIPEEGGMRYIIEATGHNPNHDADMAYLEAVQPRIMLALLERLVRAEMPPPAPTGSLKDRTTAAAIRALRESGHSVVIWTPDEIPEAASISSLESVVIMRGNDYLAAHEDEGD